jgi:hypothetical protein
MSTRRIIRAPETDFDVEDAEGRRKEYEVVEEGGVDVESANAKLVEI